MFYIIVKKYNEKSARYEVNGLDYAIATAQAFYSRQNVEDVKVEKKN